MKLLIDATNIKTGGGVQVATSLITELLTPKYASIQSSFVVSEQVHKQLPVTDYRRITVINTGAKTLLPFNQDKKRLKILANKFDVVFTVFGPCFWGNAKNHVIGFANAWLVTPNTIAYDVFNPFDAWVYRLKNYLLAKILYDKNAFYFTESFAVKEKFIALFNAKEEQIEVVSNTLPYVYENKTQIRSTYKLPCKYDKYFKLISITYNYPHKNLKVIERVGEILQRDGFKAIFIVTFSDREYKKMSTGFKKYSYNIGPLDVRDCPSVYEQCDALFLPTLIECFSVSYLEAMYNKLPILTSDLDFAKEICSSSGLYFDPFSHSDIAEKIKQLISSADLSDELIANGIKMLTNYPDNSEKISAYIEHIRHFIGDKNV